MDGKTARDNAAAFTVSNATSEIRYQRHFLFLSFTKLFAKQKALLVYGPRRYLLQIMLNAFS